MAKQSTAVAAATAPGPAPARLTGLMATFAGKYNVDPDKMKGTLKATAFKTGKNDPEVTDEQLMALLIVAQQYNLNPFTKEIYAFPDNKGGIVPMVPIDGWIRIINEHPALDAIEFKDSSESGDEHNAWFECSITRKDRSKPVVVREYFAECKRNTQPWQSHPRRMLRHKALIQCARIAFGFAGIHDPDEGEGIRSAIDVTPASRKPTTTAPRSVLSAPNEFDQSAPPVDEPHQSLASADLVPPDEEEAGARG
jgi:phage recombination protein Bet